MVVNVALVSFTVTKSATAGVGSSSRGHSDMASRLTETVVETGSGAGKIALVSLDGVISGSISGSLGGSMVDDFKATMRRAAEDSEVTAIVVKIDSPGGELTASDVIYNEVRKARDLKPVVIYMNSVAASGGYYAACGGSFIMANETTITGSIGVIIQTLNYRDLLGKIGLEAVVFKSGEFKDMLSGTRELREDEREYVQNMVMQSYEKFLGIVADSRSMSADEMRTGVADGRIISGLDAEAAGLVDGLGYLEDAFEKARDLSGAPDAQVIGYVVPFQFGNVFRMFGEARQTRIEFDISERLLPRLESGRIYLLPAFYAQ